MLQLQSASKKEGAWVQCHLTEPGVMTRFAQFRVRIGWWSDRSISTEELVLLSLRHQEIRGHPSWTSDLNPCALKGWS
jgi:hypothetical protein